MGGSPKIVTKVTGYQERQGTGDWLDRVQGRYARES
jgi:hypothetical protein